MKVIVVSTALVSSALSVKLRDDANHQSLWEHCSSDADCPSGKKCNGKGVVGEQYCKEPSSTSCRHM